jgi:hypothetical protein
MQIEQAKEILQSRRLHWSIKVNAVKSYITLNNYNFERDSRELGISVNTLLEYLRLADWFKKLPTLSSLGSAKEALALLELHNENPQILREKINEARTRTKIYQINKKKVAQYVSSSKDKRNAKIDSARKKV